MGVARRGLAVLLVLTGLVVGAPLAPAASPAAGPDPTRPGPLGVTRIDYDAGPAVLAVQPTNGAPIPVDLRGDLHLPSGRGPFPVVLFLHGRHGTCAYAGDESLGHPCPTTPATAPVESYRGYGYLARNLASHGYLVASVDANGINTYDTADLDSGSLARAELISRTLDLLSTWHAGSGPGAVGTRLKGKVDVRRLGLMGHSRGGEGVARWLAYNKERTDGPRYTASAIFALAPTDFGNHVVRDTTPYAVLLPRCDGDVSDLQGADVFERSQYAGRGPLHQITVEGANHNWFNSIWTFDDFGPGGDAACGSRGTASIRLTIAEQERVGLAWMGAFFQRYVGGKVAFEPMLSGRMQTTSHCSKAALVACRNVVDLSYQPPPSRLTTVLVPAVDGPSVFYANAMARVTASSNLTLAACDADRSWRCPTQGGSTPSRSKGAQLGLSWEQAAALTVTANAPWRGDPRGDVVVRLGVNATTEMHTLGTGAARLRLQLTDTKGHSRTVRITPDMGAPEPPPGSTVRNLLLSDVRVPLRLFRGVDVTALRSIRLLLDDASGSLQLADLALHAP